MRDKFMKKIILFDTGYPDCIPLQDNVNDIKSTHIVADSITKNMPNNKHLPPPIQIPAHRINMDVPTAKKSQLVTQKDASDIVTFDQIEDGRVVFSERVRLADSAPAPQKLKTTPKPVKIGDLNAVLIPQQWQQGDRKIAPMTVSEALMARGSGVIVEDPKELAQRRKGFNRLDLINEDPNREIPCTNGIAPLKISDLVGKMRVVNYQ